MQVETAAALAPVLARFSIVVDGPLEAEVLSRIVAGGDRATALADLARPFPAHPEMSRPDAVAVVRTVVARLLASGTVEHVGGGYRIADPALATALQRVVDAVTAAGRLPPGGAAAGGGASGPGLGVAPVAAEEASRLLQQTLGARWAPVSSVPPAGSATGGAPVGRPAIPPAWDPLLAAGWTVGLVGGETSAAAPVRHLASAGDAPAIARIVVADPAGPPAGLARRLARAGPVTLAHVPTSPVRWGRGDPTAAREAARHLAGALATSHGSAHAPVVLDRDLVPALAVLARSGRLPPVVVVDLRSVPTRSAPGPGATSAPEPTVLAQAMAGASGAVAPTRRLLGRRHAGRGPATLLEVLFGPRFAAGVLDEEEVADGQDGAEESARRAGAGGVVVTARADDPQAEALGELLGVEVVHLRAGEDLAPEVAAWLEDEDGRVLLAPKA